LSQSFLFSPLPLLTLSKERNLGLFPILSQSLQKYHSFLIRREYREEEEMPYFTVFPRVERVDTNRIIL
jgi:hypothetical protein